MVTKDQKRGWLLHGPKGTVEMGLGVDHIDVLEAVEKGLDDLSSSAYMTNARTDWEKDGYMKMYIEIAVVEYRP